MVYDSRSRKSCSGHQTRRTKRLTCQEVKADNEIYTNSPNIWVCLFRLYVLSIYTQRGKAKLSQQTLHNKSTCFTTVLLYQNTKNINYSSRNQLHQRPQFSLLRYSEILALWANTSLRDDHSTGNPGSYLGKLLCKCSLKSSLTSELLRNSSTGRADQNHLVLLGCYCYASPQR